MKAKSSVAKSNKPSAVEQPKPRKEIFPDPLLIMQDIPSDLPPITHKEILAYDNAQHMYKIAKADFERRHANLVFKLLTLHKVEKGSDYEACLDEEGRLVVYEPCDNNCNSSKVDLTRH